MISLLMDYHFCSQLICVMIAEMMAIVIAEWETAELPHSINPLQFPYIHIDKPSFNNMVSKILLLKVHLIWKPNVLRWVFEKRCCNSQKWHVYNQFRCRDSAESHNEAVQRSAAVSVQLSCEEVRCAMTPLGSMVRLSRAWCASREYVTPSRMLTCDASFSRKGCSFPLQ